jgi:hypothetical protein
MPKTTAELIQDLQAQEQRIAGNVSDTYTALAAKHATMPVSQNSSNLASTVSTITPLLLDAQSDIAYFGADSGGLYLSTSSADANTFALGLDDDRIYVQSP